MTSPSAPALPLETDRLTLRNCRTDDVTSLLAYYSDPTVARYLLHEPWTPEQAEREVAKLVERRTIGICGQALSLVVEREGTVIGDVSLVPTDDTLSQAEIGWVFHPDFGGKGYATEAVRAVIRMAFGHYTMHRVKAQLDPRNKASARMCERLGMTKEAHLRQDWWSKDEWTDTAVYGLLATDRGSESAR
ncbi:MAG TPA: GNAT family N-acetyltransferase [Jiangellaceae bacterium]|nr:GNAT family N-acetyltransferase [Jiangellaceae bacterium]